MNRVSDLGTKLDSKRRQTLLRLDDSQKRDKVTLSRTFVYNQGRNVNSDAVEKILSQESLTPTKVKGAFQLTVTFN